MGFGVFFFMNCSRFRSLSPVNNRITVLHLCRIWLYSVWRLYLLHFKWKEKWCLTCRRTWYTWLDPTGWISSLVATVTTFHASSRCLSFILPVEIHSVHQRPENLGKRCIFIPFECFFLPCAFTKNQHSPGHIGFCFPWSASSFVLALQLSNCLIVLGKSGALSATRWQLRTRGLFIQERGGKKKKTKHLWRTQNAKKCPGCHPYCPICWAKQPLFRL